MLMARDRVRDRETLVVGRVIGDVLEPFTKSVSLKITYSNNREVTSGCELKPSHVLNRPRVEIGGDDRSVEAEGRSSCSRVVLSAKDSEEGKSSKLVPSDSSVVKETPVAADKQYEAEDSHSKDEDNGISNVSNQQCPQADAVSETQSSSKEAGKKKSKGGQNSEQHDAEGSHSKGEETPSGSKEAGSKAKNKKKGKNKKKCKNKGRQ